VNKTLVIYLHILIVHFWELFVNLFCQISTKGGKPLIGWLTNFEKKEKEKEMSLLTQIWHPSFFSPEKIS